MESIILLLLVGAAFAAPLNETVELFNTTAIPVPESASTSRLTKGAIAGIAIGSFIGLSC